MKTKTKTKKTEAAFDYTTIKTKEDAFKKCGYDPNALPDLSMIPEKLRASLMAAFILMVIFEAINNGWKPDYSNDRQGKYFPWPWVSSSGLGFRSSYYGYAYADAHVGSRLCTDSSEKALYILNQFEDLWKTWLLGIE